MMDFIKDNAIIITISISFIALVVAIFRIKILREKHRIDKEEFANKKSNFSVFLEDCYRVSYSTSKIMNILFSIMITNRSSSKNTIIPKLEIDYIENNKTRTVKLSHNNGLFDKKHHGKIDKFTNNIQLDAKDIKSGWIIFQMPENLQDKRIERYRVIIQDGENNISNAESLLIKDIHYDD